MCARSREIIPGLLRRVNIAENQIQKYKKIAQTLMFLLIVVLVIMFFQFLGGDVCVGNGDGNLQLS